MSAATEFPPVVHIPDRARPARPVARTVVHPVSRPVSRPGGRVVVVTFPAQRVDAPARSCLTLVPEPVGGRAAPGSVAGSEVRLTRRAWALLIGAAVAVAAVLVVVATLSHPAASSHAAGGAGARPLPARVVVQPGDTLWSIAGRIAPTRDPRAVVYDLQQANHLSSPDVTPGQVLQVS